MGELRWNPPVVHLNPSPEELVAFLEKYQGNIWSLDVETLPAYLERGKKGFDVLHDRLGCLGLKPIDAPEAMVVPFESRESEEKNPPNQVLQEYCDILIPWLANPNIEKVGHNFGYYDRMVIENNLGVTPANVTDTILLHKFAEPEAPSHKLGYLGSIFTDVSDWKANHLATEAETDAQWHTYCAYDCAVTGDCVEPLVKLVTERKQEKCIEIAHKIQDLCVNLRKNGMLIDQKLRAEIDARLQQESAASRKLCCDIAEAEGFKKFNPGSTQQVRDLLYNKWELQVERVTEEGDPSTDEVALCQHILDHHLTSKQRTFVDALRKHRGSEKERGTYIERMALRSYGGSGNCDSDGRIRADYSAHAVLGWRLSSSGAINAQTVTPSLRHLIIAAPGNVLVGCDQAQLELRVLAGMAKIAYYLERMAVDADPHWDLCVDIFGKTFLNATKDQQKTIRTRIKALTYASAFCATAKTRWKILRFEETAGVFTNRDMRLADIEAFDVKWHARNPEIEPFWRGLYKEWQRNGYLTEPIFGARCDFLDGDNHQIMNKLSNFPVQSCGAALVHLATFRFLEKVPFQKWGPGTGLINQCHDSLLVECPAREAEWVAKYLAECMTIDGNQWGMPVVFKGEAAIGKNWHAV
jgi:DNA polymerase-1